MKEMSKFLIVFFFILLTFVSKAESKVMSIGSPDAKVTIIITFLLSNISDNFPIGHWEIAPDTASINVTNEIWKIEKFIVVA